MSMSLFKFHKPILGICKILFFIFISVESNDKLYGGDDKFINEVQTVCVTLVNQILTHLNTLNATEVQMSHNI